MTYRFARMFNFIVFFLLLLMIIGILVGMYYLSLFPDVGITGKLVAALVIVYGCGGLYYHDQNRIGVFLEPYPGFKVRENDLLICFTVPVAILVCCFISTYYTFWIFPKYVLSTAVFGFIFIFAIRTWNGLDERFNRIDKTRETTAFGRWLGAIVMKLFERSSNHESD